MDLGDAQTWFFSWSTSRKFSSPILLLNRLDQSVLRSTSCNFPMTSEGEDAVRRRGAVTEYRKKMLQNKELDSRVRGGQISQRLFSYTIPNFFCFYGYDRFEASIVLPVRWCTLSVLSEQGFVVCLSNIMLGYTRLLYWFWNWLFRWCCFWKFSKPKQFIYSRPVGEFLECNYLIVGSRRSI